MKAQYVLQRVDYRGEWKIDEDYGTFDTKAKAAIALKAAKNQYPVWSWQITKLESVQS